MNMKKKLQIAIKVYAFFIITFIKTYSVENKNNLDICRNNLNSLTNKVIFNEQDNTPSIEKNSEINDIIEKNNIFKPYTDDIISDKSVYYKYYNNEEMLSKYKYFISYNCGRTLGGCCSAYYVLFDKDSNLYFCNSFSYSVPRHHYETFCK